MLRLQANTRLTKGKESDGAANGPRNPTTAPNKHSIRAGHRAQSVQNICRIPVAVPSNGKAQTGRAMVKRAASSQNISAKPSQPLQPSVNAAAAYNAELLANFEREKKTLEAHIADLTRQLEEAKACEEQSGIAYSDELISLRTENSTLREQLANEQQLRAGGGSGGGGGGGGDHFTDAEKLRLLQWQTLSPQQRNSVGDLRVTFDSRPVAAGGLDRRSSVSVDCGLDHGPASVAALRDRLALMKVSKLPFHLH